MSASATQAVQRQMSNVKCPSNTKTHPIKAGIHQVDPPLTRFRISSGPTAAPVALASKFTRGVVQFSLDSEGRNFLLRAGGPSASSFPESNVQGARTLFEVFLAGAARSGVFPRQPPNPPT